MINIRKNKSLIYEKAPIDSTGVYSYKAYRTLSPNRSIDGSA